MIPGWVTGIPHALGQLSLCHNHRARAPRQKPLMPQLRADAAKQAFAVTRPWGTSADQWLSWNGPWESPREATALDNHPRIPLKCFARVHGAQKVLGFMLFYPFLFFGWAFQLEMQNTKAIPGHSLQTCHEAPLRLISRGLGLGLLSPALQMPGTLKTVTERDPGPPGDGDRLAKS